MPGVLIVEAFGQAAAALTAHGLDKSTYENKLVFLMSVEKARFRILLYQIANLNLKLRQSDLMAECGNIKVKHSLKILKWLMLYGLQLLLIGNN